MSGDVTWVVRASAIGSSPGDDLPAALRLTLGELGEQDGPGEPYLPELPARGVHAQTIGRTAAMLSGLSVDLQPAGWRLTDAPGIDARRARGLLRDDLDHLEEAAQGYTGPLTLTAAGPWTLAAAMERPRGDRVLADHGARRELAESLAEGVAGLAAEVGRRLPVVRLAVQLDEPSAPAVLRGSVRTASGFSRHRAVRAEEASTAWSRVVTALAGVGVEDVRLHCCAPGLDLGLVTGAGIGTVLLDAAVLDARDLDRLGTALEGGTALGLGVQPTTPVDVALGPDRLARRALELLQPLELGPEIAGRVLLTPACGLASWTSAPATLVLRDLVVAAGIVTEQLAR